MEDDSRELYRHIIKQERREARIEKLQLILAIVTTTAVIWLCFLMAILGVIYLNNNNQVPFIEYPTPAQKEVVPVPIPEIQA